MSRFADIRVEWRVAEIESTLRQKADRYEISSLRSNVDSLERANRELGAEVIGLRGELEILKEMLRNAFQNI
jgi:hypothetical protein